MEDSPQTHNDKLMRTGYEILEQCKELSYPCFIWGGGAIYHLLNGKLDYRKMSDIEFLLPKSVDKGMEKILLDKGFIPYSTFNNMQNMYEMPRREYYLPNRELTEVEIGDIKHGSKGEVKDVQFQKLELFVDGIRMCWKFTIKDMPKSYAESLICPPGFQLALKANPIHPDDFDLKDVQDIANILNLPNTEIAELDTIFTDTQIDESNICCIGTKMFERLSRSKDQFATTAHRNLSHVLEYSGLNEAGTQKAEELIKFLTPLLAKDKGGFFAKMRREKPVRVDSRER
ncbi:MAG: hypothetical protein ACXACP_04215 [Candidatus Hodarchaeales archaeon]|jgi:hypothetical protein